MRLVLLGLLLAQAPRGLADYQKARALTDPQARVAALETFLGEYGQGGVANRAREDVVRALAESGAADEAIGAFVRRAMEQATPFQKTELPQRLADALLELGRALGVAEELAAPGTTARLRATHGRVLLARGDRLGARRVLEGVVAANPEIGSAVAALVEVEPDPAKKLEYRALAQMLSGSAGSFDAALLDRVYAERFGRAVVVERRPPARPGRRPVLVEFYTSASCLPCQGAELAFDALIERFSESELVAIAHHVNIPGPDPLTHGQARPVEGVPVFFVDGEAVSEGGTRAAAGAIYEELERRVLGGLGRPRAGLKLMVRRLGGQLEVTVNPGARVALVERQVTHSGANAIRFHRHVVRQFIARAPRRLLFAAEPGREWRIAAVLGDGRIADAAFIAEGRP